MPNPIGNRPVAPSVTTTPSTRPAVVTTPAAATGTPAWAPTTPRRHDAPTTGGMVGTPTQPTPAVPVSATSPAASTVPVMHRPGATVLEGRKINALALQQLNDLKIENFGTTTLKLPSGDGGEKIFTVRDMQYELGDGKIGARIVGVKDNDAAASAKMDALIRKESGLGPNDPIFTLVAYIHPEEHTATLAEAGTKMLKTEMGNTHLGAYVGESKTTNSPNGYHSKTWGVGEGGKPYPANVQLISMEGVPQAQLNKTLVAADAILNAGVVFPSDYKNDPMRTVDLNSTLMFYKEWLRADPNSFLKTDPSWATYCAEHKTIVTNVALNVPQNEDSFKEVFGAEEGAKAWGDFKARFKETAGRDFTTADETHFEPLWKKEGLKASQIRPPTKEQYDAYRTARFDDSLANGTYRGYQPLPAGRGMAWKPETTADLVKNFLETYASFRDVGGYAMVATALGFKDTVTARMGIDSAKYLETAMPMLNKIMVAEGMARAPADAAGFQKWAERATASIYVAIGGKPEDFAPGAALNPQLMAVAKATMQGVAQAAPQIMQAAKIPTEKRNDAAYAWMRTAIAGDMEKARNTRVGSAKNTEAYSPPAVTNRVVNGIVEKSKFVNIKVIATAMDEKYLEPE
jgi:hypothetical protein